MKRFAVFLGVGALASSLASHASSGLHLTELLFNVDGSGGTYDSYADFSTLNTPGGVNLSGFHLDTGLGTIQFSTSVAGVHTFIGMVDHEIDLDPNGLKNELGFAHGSAGVGQSWEIDEPGLATSGYTGDIYDHATGSSTGGYGVLDNSVGTTDPNDVSMALGYDFLLGPLDTAYITLKVSETAPTSGFYLEQNDPDSVKSIYFSSSLSITTATPGVPDGGSTLSALSLGLAALAALKYRIGRA